MNLAAGPAAPPDGSLPDVPDTQVRVTPSRHLASAVVVAGEDRRQKPTSALLSVLCPGSDTRHFSSQHSCQTHTDPPTCGELGSARDHMDIQW